MTLITFEDGKAVMKGDGTIGTEQACCCEQECECPADCVAGLFVSLGGDPQCFEGFYQDHNPDLGAFYVEMDCDEGVWTIMLYRCAPGTGVWQYIPAIDSSCLPVAGDISPEELTEITNFDPNNDAPPIPTISILRT